LVLWQKPAEALYILGDEGPPPLSGAAGGLQVRRRWDWSVVGKEQERFAAAVCRCFTEEEAIEINARLEAQVEQTNLRCDCSS
jgi:hypothetical protein